MSVYLTTLLPLIKVKRKFYLIRGGFIIMRLKAVGYRRVSTEDQAEDGHSLDAQQRAIEEFINQKGWQLGPIYTDAGLSGQLDQRPALRQLLQDAEAGHFNVVVVHAIDRFYRSLTGLLTAIEQLNRQGVGFVSITENLDFTTPWGKLALAVLGTLAEIYIDKLSAETKKGKLERARKGYYNGSIPFGYCNGCCSTCTDPNGPGYCPHAGQPDRGDGEGLIAHPLEAIGVRRAYKWSATGIYTDRDIADALNRQSVRYQGQNYILRPKRRPGDVQRFGPPVFVKDSIREMLQRIFYTGVVPYFGTKNNKQKRKRKDVVALYPGRHPALIPQALFDQVQAARRLRHTAPTPPGKTDQHFIYPLSGLLYCGNCGNTMRSASNQQGKRYHRCATRIQQGSECDQVTLLADSVEQQLLQRFQKLKFLPDWRSHLSQALTQNEDKQNQLEALQQSLTRTKELYLEGDIERDEYERRRSVYRAQLADLTDIPLAAIIAASYLVENFQAIWEREDKRLNKKLLRVMLAAVTVRGDALHGWEPNSAFYPLLRHALSFSMESSCQSGSDGN